jgi:hypothetical protein
VGLVEAEQQHGVGDVLADARQRFDFVAGRGEPSAPRGNGSREGLEAGRSLCGKADWLEKSLDFLDAGGSQTAPGWKAGKKGRPEGGDRLCSGALEEDFGDDLVEARSTGAAPGELAPGCCVPLDQYLSEELDIAGAYEPAAEFNSMWAAPHFECSCDRGR